MLQRLRGPGQQVCGLQSVWSPPGWLRGRPLAGTAQLLQPLLPPRRASRAPHPLPSAPLPGLERSPRNKGSLPPTLVPLQLSLKCRAPEVSQHVYQAYETILKN